MFSNVLQLTTVNTVTPSLYWESADSSTMISTNAVWKSTMPILSTTCKWLSSGDGLSWYDTLFTGNTFNAFGCDNIYMQYACIVSTSIKELTAVTNTLFTSDVYKRAVRLMLKGDGLNDAQNNTFLDSSTNNFAITRAGTVTQGSFSPYALNGVAYSPAIHGGSAYFDGSSYLSFPANDAFNLGDTHTIEFWINPTNSSNQLFQMARTVTNYFKQFAITMSGNFILYTIRANTGSQFPTQTWTATTPCVLNQWNHVAVSVSSGTLRFYINGTSSGTFSSIPAYVFSTSDFVTLGHMPNGHPFTNILKGYISDFKIMKGTALYTDSALTVPTAPLTNVTNTSLLLNFTNGGIIDSTAKNDLTTVGNAKVSTSVVKYGTGSMYFDGTGDYLTIPTTVNLDVYTVFTIECWLYRTTANDCCFLDARRGTNEVGYIAIVSNRLKVTLTSPSDVFYSTSTIPLNVWTHVAFVSDSSGSRIYLNGTQDATTVGVANWGGENRPAYIGDAYHSSSGYYGYMDDFRITKAAVYTSNFTPPGSLTYP